MRNPIGIVAIAAAVALMGAGCAAAPEETTPKTAENVPPVVIPEPAPEPVADPEVVSAFEEALEEAPTLSKTDSMNREFSGKLPDEEIQGKQVRLKTKRGDIVFELYPDTAPLAVSNFVSLANDGYFNGLTFHRREEGFVIQGGDPSGNGTGGPGYTFEDELVDNYQYERGIVAMANRGPDTNGSQFFVMLGDVPLPKAYTIFGRVTEGMDAVDAIQIGDEMVATVEDAESLKP